MADNKTISQEVYSQWTKPILIGIFITVVMLFFIFRAVKDTETFKHYMGTYTEYYNIQKNMIVNNIHSILSFYKNGGGESMPNISGLSYQKKDNGIIIDVVPDDVYGELSIESIKNIVHERKGNQVFIQLSSLVSDEVLNSSVENVI